MKSFYEMFYILDRCYEICSEDDLGGLLGAISPELWGGRPMDWAMYEDWEEYCHGKGKNLDIIQRIYSFLLMYEEQFGFNFSQTRQVLKSSISSEHIAAAKDYAEKMVKDT